MHRTSFLQSGIVIVLGAALAWVVKVPITTAAASNAAPNDALQLNVIVFEAQVNRDDRQTTFVELPPDFPVLLSRSVAAVRTQSLPFFPELPLLGNASLLDIFTFVARQRTGPESKTQSRSNDLAQLKYKIRFLSWLADRYEVEIQHELRGRKRDSVKVVCRSDKTTIVVSSGPKQANRLLIALTPVISVPFVTARHLTSSTPFGTVSDPAIIASPTPKYPEKLAEARVPGRVRLKGVIRKDGLVDPEEFVLLECAHFLFGRAALATVAQGWKFRPAMKDNVPVDMVVTIEITFKIG